jgi:hypothetical protein
MIVDKLWLEARSVKPGGRPPFGYMDFNTSIDGEE